MRPDTGTIGPGTIAVLCHASDRFGSQPYVLGHLAAIWTRTGHRVMHHTEWTRLPECDLLVLHVDLTRVPQPLLDLVHAHPRVLNRGAVDISKRRFSRLLVRPEDGYRGPVILKTNLNFGGLPEARSLGLTRLPAEGWGRRWCLPPSDYPILAGPEQVPAEAWGNPALVVERFLPERTEEGHFCVRSWLFLGEAGVVWRSHSRHPLVKAGNAFRHDLMREVPDEVRALRSAMGLDFGKIDFGIVEGKTVIYDVNKTPTQAKVTERSRPVLEAMAVAVEAFLERGTPE
jgi:hypothetical protein